MNTLAKRQIKILDGGMGTALRERSAQVKDYKSSIWSAAALIEDPDCVRNLHVDYIKAGAQVITANNYALTRPLLAREGMAEQLPDLLKRSIRLALEAREEAQISQVRIAASLPPLQTSYRADLVGPFEEILEQYREIAKLTSDDVDLFICETMTTPNEALAALTAAKEHGKESWVAFTLNPATGCLRGGASLQEALAGLKGGNPAAILVNCTDCATATKSIPLLKSLTDLPIGAYCNPVLREPPGGEPEREISRKLSAAEYAEMTKQWVSDGATLIGGCCDTNPDYITALKHALT